MTELSRNGAGGKLTFADITQVYEDGDSPVMWGLIRETVEVRVLAHLTLDGEPVSKSRARFTNYRSPNRVYTPEKTRTAENRVAAAFRATVPGWRPSADHGFGVLAVFFAESFQRRDVDNMLKLILDACNGVVWVDDAQVVEVSGRVVKGVDDPRTEIAVYFCPQSSRPTKACEQCGKRFEAYKSQAKRRFCTRACGYQWRRDQQRRNCPRCGTEFFTSSDKRKAHCSRECADAARRVDVPCVQCGTLINKPQSLAAHRGNDYCSDECKANYWRPRRAAKAKGTCSVCGGPTSKKTYRRCNPCKRSGREA